MFSAILISITFVCLMKVLIQGCLVTKENLQYVLELIHEQLVNLEDVLARQTACSFVGETQVESPTKEA